MGGCTVGTFVTGFLPVLVLSDHPLVFLLRFLRLWIAVLVIYPTNQAVIALTFSNYVLQPLFPTCFPPESGLRLLAGVCLCECLLLSDLQVQSHKTRRFFFFF